jgi:hypothetical protein
VSEIHLAVRGSGRSESDSIELESFEYRKLRRRDGIRFAGLDPVVFEAEALGGHATKRAPLCENVLPQFGGRASVGVAAAHADHGE